VDALDLHVEQRGGIDRDPGALEDQPGQIPLVLALDATPRIEKPGVSERELEPRQLLLGARDPPFAEVW